MSLTLQLSKGLVDIDEEVENQSLAAQPEILAEFIARYLEEERRAAERAGKLKELLACPKHQAKSRYVGSKIKLHKEERYLARYGGDSQSCRYFGRSPLEKDIYSLQKEVVKLKGEYYGTQCQCGQCKTKPKHEQWLAKHGAHLCTVYSCYQDGRSCGGTTDYPYRRQF